MTSMTILLRHHSCTHPLSISSRPVSEELHHGHRKLTRRFLEQHQVVLSLLSLNYFDGFAKSQFIILQIWTAIPQSLQASFLDDLFLFEVVHS